MCTSPITIKFANPILRAYNISLHSPSGSSVPCRTRYVRKYRLGLPTDVSRPKQVPFAQPKHLQERLVPDGSQEVFEPISETCDSSRYPFPSHNVYKQIAIEKPHIIPSFAIPEDLHSSVVSLQVPCGKCEECVAKYLNEVTDIVEQDIKACKDVCSFFVTLTYDPKHLPTDTDQCKLPVVDITTGEISPFDGFAHCPSGFLHRKDLQDYFKNLRIFLKRWYDVEDVRIVQCGEYGKDHIRPHYHYLIWFEHNEKTRSGYPCQCPKYGKKSIMSYYLVNGQGKSFAGSRVPPLSLCTYRYFSWRLWSKCQPQAHRVELPRSVVACGRYISKYLLKCKLGLPEELKQAFAPYARPMFFRISNNIGLNVLDRYCNVNSLQRGTFFVSQKNKIVEIPINSRIMRKISRLYYGLGLVDYFGERSKYLEDYIIKQTREKLALFNRLTGSKWHIEDITGSFAYAVKRDLRNFFSPDEVEKRRINLQQQLKKVSNYE